MELAGEPPAVRAHRGTDGSNPLSPPQRVVQASFHATGPRAPFGSRFFAGRADPAGAARSAETGIARCMETGHLLRIEGANRS
jgi:hypothetical protein